MPSNHSWVSISHKPDFAVVLTTTQVGIIALNLIGDVRPSAPDAPPEYLDVSAPAPNPDVAYYNRAAADMADLNLDLHVDSITAAHMRELAKAKDAAVAAEDYDEAKRLKLSIDRLRVSWQ